MLDEGLDVLAGLWSGEPFSYSGKHLTVDQVRFAPTPPQRPRIPVWVVAVLPAPRPIARADRWDGIVPIRLNANGLVRPSPDDIANLTGRITAMRGNAAGYDMVVWAEVASEPAELPGLA